MICRQCGHENPETNKFCGECAAPLKEPTRYVAEERKTVTALFCDLVGFTATSESADPEDVNTMLDTYAAMARAQIENHGGVVQKFIGDAVVGVFGVPAGHEDDPERAVRAGLRIVEAAEKLKGVGDAPLRLRVGINTGEALVRLGVSPGSGEGFLTGDAINVASRLQGIAPEMGVAVGLATYEATQVVFDYQELKPAIVKGKAKPVRVFRPTVSRAQFGTDLTRPHSSPFVGREIDLALLKGIFDKTVASEWVQLVTVVGEPGLGKSRIVAELFGYIDQRPELVTWRQGRCAPYGEGITFWALGEIIKAHSGILESDDPATAAAKLDEVLPEGEERAWFRQRLLPLLGIEASSSAEREELFTAWQLFVEHIAEASPTVLVFEDLHWADDALVLFLEHLADRAEGVPLLIVCTARPELFECHPDFGAGLRNTNSINLAPLSVEETARLVAALLDASVISVELQQPILDRAGGNPLYAEEFVRLLKDKDLLVRTGTSWELREGAEVPFPDSVRALIAARLDTLNPDVKSLLADAAVVGKVFWAGALAAMGRRDHNAVIDMLRDLSRKELVRPARRSSMHGEAEYAFWHILTRDVTYAQLPRASRAARHVTAAAWIESRTTERVEDMADVLAHHYATALELARAAGEADLAEELESPALRFLTLAGERALGLDTVTALSNFERALALTPAGHPERPGILERFGVASEQAGRTTEAIEVLQEATASFLSRGDPAAAARVMLQLCNCYFGTDDPRWKTIAGEALGHLEPLPPRPELVLALSEMAGDETLQSRHQAGIRYADRALALAEELGLPRPARALGFRGFARANLGDAGGLHDLREAIGLATRAGQGREVGVLHSNLGAAIALYEGPAACVEVMRAGIAFSKARGMVKHDRNLRLNMIGPMIDLGAIDQTLEIIDGLKTEAKDDGSGYWSAGIRLGEVRIAAIRGTSAQIAGMLTRLESSTRMPAKTNEFLVEGLGVLAFARVGLGQNDRAAALLTELAASPETRDTIPYSWLLPGLVRTAIVLGDRSLAARLVVGLEPRHPYAEHALITATAVLAEAGGDHQAAAAGYADAAQRWQQFGVVAEHALALQGHGCCLINLGRVNEAVPILQHARQLFHRLNATPALAETDLVLQHATTLSS